MGDKYRYRNDTDKLRHFQLVLMFFWWSDFFTRGGGLLSRRLRGRCHAPDYRRSGAGDVFVCAAAAQTWSHDAIVFQRSKNTRPAANSRPTVLTCVWIVKSVDTDQWMELARGQRANTLI